MANYQIEERGKLRRLWVEQAIALAMASKWDEAVKVNQLILEAFPNDVDALNRAGRALTELGRYADARSSYQRAVEIDPNNGIAQKNLTRLASLRVESDVGQSHEKVDPRLFIAETGKSGVTNLVRVIDRAGLARMGVGDQVYLHVDGRALLVRNARGETLGQAEPKTSQRLIDLIRGGNEYQAAIMSLDESAVRIIIRESFQHPSQTGKVSFPSRGPDASAIRPYIKDSLLKYEVLDEEEDGEDNEFGADGEGESEESADALEYDEERPEE